MFKSVIIRRARRITLTGGCHEKLHWAWTVVLVLIDFNRPKREIGNGLIREKIAKLPEI